MSKPDKHRKYDDAFQAEDLRLARESRSTQAAARQLGISEKLLAMSLATGAGCGRSWQCSTGLGPSLPRPAGRESASGARASYFKKSLGHLRPRNPVSSYYFVKRQHDYYPVRELCWVLGVAPSAYYAWRQRWQRPAPTWERAACWALAYHARRYGTRRLRAELQAAGYQVGRYRFSRALCQHGLRAQQPRSFVPRTTGSGHGQRVAPNWLLGRARPCQPDQV